MEGLDKAEGQLSGHKWMRKREDQEVVVWRDILNTIHFWEITKSTMWLWEKVAKVKISEWEGKGRVRQGSVST